MTARLRIDRELARRRNFTIPVVNSTKARIVQRISIGIATSTDETLATFGIGSA